MHTKNRNSDELFWTIKDADGKVICYVLQDGDADAWLTYLNGQK